MLILELFILIYSAILHEIAHGYAAERLGDPTARVSGRLTLDPRPHIDPWLTIALPLVLVLIHSPVVFGGAKPVPIDPYNFRHPKKDIALASAAGPATNFGLAAAAGLLFNILAGGGNNFASTLPGTILLIIVEINIALGFFNLLPIPPLDGYKIVGGLLPGKYAGIWYSAERFGLVIVIFLMFFMSSQITGLIFNLTGTVTHLLVSGGMKTL